MIISIDVQFMSVLILFYLFLSSINSPFGREVDSTRAHYYIACLKSKFLFHRRNIFRASCPSGSTLDGP